MSKRLKTDNYLSDYKKQGYVGSVDVNIEISLYEYGLIHKKLKDGSYIFVYGVTVNEDNEYTEFDDSTFTEKEFEELIEKGGWFELNDILSFCDIKKEEWLKLPLYQRIYDSFLFHGYENIFGTSYGGYEITSNQRRKIKEEL